MKRFDTIYYRGYGTSEHRESIMYWSGVRPPKIEPSQTLDLRVVVNVEQAMERYSKRYNELGERR